MKLNVHLLTWNGSKYIPFLFDSLRKQTFKDWQLVILDNASTDDTVEKVKKELLDFDIEHKLIINKENKGFAGGHNQLFENSEFRTLNSELVLLLNQDMYLMPDCLEKLVEFMNKNSEAAVVSPRLMKWDFVNKIFTDQIDTLGLKVLRNRRVIELGAGQEWTQNVIPAKAGIQTNNCRFLDPRIREDDSLEVFGVSGALPMFRKSVIDEVGLFDETYGSYKEDVDLAYRLRLAGHKAFVLLNAVAYHDRSAAGPENLGDSIAIANKKQQSSWVKYHSYKNHLMSLIKNEYWQNYLLDLPFIKWYELKKFLYFLLFERSVLKGLREIWKNRKALKNKRQKNIQLRKISWQEMRKWWK